MDQFGGLTKRQLFGIEYTAYSKNLPRITNTERHGEQYSFVLKGKAKKPPEVEMLDFKRNGLKAVVVYHDLDQFLVRAKGGKTLDLVAITPEGWTQKAIQLTSPEYKAPEIHMAFENYLEINVPGKECIISEGFGTDNKKACDTAVLAVLWNTLIARFTGEVGEPFNQQGADAMRQSVLQRRTEVIDSLNGNTQDNPQQVATKSFKS